MVWHNDYTYIISQYWYSKSKKPLKIFDGIDNDDTTLILKTFLDRSDKLNDVNNVNVNDQQSIILNDLFKLVILFCYINSFVSSF